MTNPPVSLTQVFFECNNDIPNSLLTGAGIASGEKDGRVEEWKEGYKGSVAMLFIAF